MSDQTSEVVVTIQNKLGMHARAATQFVQLASKFDCDVGVEKDGQHVNGKSIMGVLMLVASKGTRIKIICRGAQAAEASDALAALVNSGFGEGIDE